MLRSKHLLVTRGLGRYVRTLCATTAEAKRVLFIPVKMKEEMLALHEEDKNRWTATTLATRFKAPQENVDALLKLGAIRRRREEALQAANGETREKITHLRTQAVKTWAALPDGSISTSRWRVAKPTHADVTGEHNLRAARKASAEPPNKSDPMTNETIAENSNTEEPEPEKSTWAEHIERICENAELDSVRKTTFAFIEVGKRQDLHRAVWIREGATGKLRLADQEERKLLTNRVTVRDSKAFLPSQ